jgi:hypothetical protein
MSSVAMEVCPMCSTCPRLAGRWRPQVRCRCGARGPRSDTGPEAIRGWNSAVPILRELNLRAGASQSVPREWKSGAARRLARRLAWQCGLSVEQFF